MCTDSETSRRERIEVFVVLDDHLIQTVDPERGKPYEHRCSRESYEAVAHAVDEAGDDGFTVLELAEAAKVPSTQVAVALAFMKERGCVETRCRRNFPASDWANEL